jgi:hypothetical protein
LLKVNYIDLFFFCIHKIVLALPTSQAVVTELMQALDAFPLSTDELDIIMQKIANKQSVVNRDWAKVNNKPEFLLTISCKF